MEPKHIFLLSCLIIAAALRGTHAVDFDVVNNVPDSAGGIRFTNEIGSDYSEWALTLSTYFVWGVFQQTTENDRKDVQQVTLIIDDFDNDAAYTINSEIHFNANYIGNYSGDLKTEFTGIIFHEMTHVWQWNADGKTPSGLIEGIAYYVRLSANYVPSHWVQPGDGDRWDQGYDVTARFLDYCEGLNSDFVAELNEKMKNGYSVDFFVELLGETVDDLWSDYKAKYGKNQKSP